MSYLTSVCGRFHGEFANPRGASLPLPRHSARFSTPVQSLEKEDG